MRLEAEKRKNSAFLFIIRVHNIYELHFIYNNEHFYKLCYTSYITTGASAKSVCVRNIHVISLAFCVACEILFRHVRSGRAGAAAYIMRRMGLWAGKMDGRTDDTAAFICSMHKV